MKEIYITYEEIELVLIGNYSKGDESSHVYPGSDNCFDCLEVLCGGQDIIDILEEHIIEDIEKLALSKIEEI